MRPLGVLPVRRRPDPTDDPRAIGRRPNAALPMAAAAFCLGVVAAATALLALQDDPTPDARRLAAAEALAAERQTALEGGTTLNGKLLAALDTAVASPAAVSAADVDELRREVTRQSTTIRERVRIVRVPVPGPTVTGRPAARPATGRAPAARPSPAAPAPAPSPPGCTIALLDVCLAR